MSSVLSSISNCSERNTCTTAVTTILCTHSYWVLVLEIRVQWTINFGSSHMRVHACDTEACDMCYVFNVNLTDSFDDRRSQCRLIE